MTDIVQGLNERQAAAVSTGAGPALALAGPGSGKTRVLTHRIAFLIQNIGVPADAIMAVTFTNKAAGEMRNRVSELLEGNVRGLQIGTFHAICARLLRKEGERTPYGRDYLIYDTDDQVAVVTQALGELNIDVKRFSPRRVLGAISTAKNELIKPGEFTALDYFGEIVARVYQRYQAILLDNNAMDFDDLLMQMVMLLREDEVVAQRYQRWFEFVLVDEFQDTNTAQYELVRLLGAPQNNVFVVGDEDQGIYAFRGADYRNVLQFRKDYPQAEVYLLEQNYRSTQIILDAARAIIDKNPNRTPKALFTDRKGGERIIVKEAYSEDFEARYVVEQIDELRREEGMDWSDFAVMYRTNAQSRAFEEICIREGIPYRLVGGVGFYKRREVRDLLAYLRLVNNGNDKVSFSRIINTPRRGIGKKSLADFQLWAASECDSYDDALERLTRGEESPLTGRSGRLFAEFGADLQRWRAIAAEGDLLNLLDTIMTDIGYNLYLNDISDSEEQAMERSENVQELRGLTTKAQDEGVTLSEFLAEQMLVADVDTLAEDMNAVTLLTLHAAKGLEYPVVFITGLEEGLMPHSRSLDDPEGMAEERRLLYVGITRAENRVYLTHAFRRTMWGSSSANTPSRFLADLPENLLDGMSPTTRAYADQRRFREQTRWSSTAFGASSGDEVDVSELRSAVRGKIVPFPGMKPKDASPTQFKTNDVVTHRIFGEGRVIESKIRDSQEEVTVAFANRKHGIKTILAEYLNAKG